MSKPLRVLLVEDSATDAELVLRELRRAGYAPEFQRVETESDFTALLDGGWEIILSDFQMPGFTGLRALEVLKASGLEIPFILISGTIGEDIAVEAMKQGAADYLLKDRLARLGQTVSHALEQTHFRRERSKAAAALRESEDRFRRLAENIQDVFWITDVPDQRILYVSPAYEVVWGRPCAELWESSLAWLESIHPEDRQRVLSAAQTKQLAGTYDEEYRIIRPDGSVRWIRDRAFPVARESGAVDRIVGVARDITESKQDADALRLFRSLVDHSSDTIEVVDPETGRYLDVNEKGCIDLGYTRAEFLTLRVSDIDTAVTPENWPALAGKIHAAMSISEEGLIRRKDGTFLPVECIAKWVRLDRDYIVKVVRDITERKRNEQRFRRLVDSNAQGVMFCKWSGGITGANEAFLQIVGYTHDDLDAGLLNWISLTPTEFAENDRRCLEELAEKGVCAPYEKEFIRKDGSLVPVLMGAAAFEDDPLEGVCFVVDLTEVKQLEHQFLRAQRMESIGTLAGGIAHDLNNVLSPIIMSLDLMKMRFSDPASMELLSVISASAHRGAAMVRQVLSFARGVEGRRMDVQVRHLLQEVEKITNDTFLKNIDVRLRISQDLWLVVGDPTQLHQVLLNLCVNARDAMPGGGTLSLRAGNIVLDSHDPETHTGSKPGPYVLVQIEDNGTGMPQKVLEKIFDPFFTTKDIGKGTGLGLSTTLAIVKSHGGFIRVTSKPGKGSSFKVYLPAKLAPSKTEAAPAVVLPRGSDELVLIIDDESSVRQISQQTLEAFGYRVLLAADGSQGVATYAARQADIAVVITDMMMPVMDGPATIQVLQRLNPAVKIIAATGLVTGDPSRQLSLLGVKAFLPKPYTTEKLLNALHDVLSQPATDAAE